MFNDMLNLPRGKYVPVGVAAGGSISFARGAFAVSYDRDLLPIPGCGVYDGLPDMDLILDAERRKGWQAGTEIALGDLYLKDTPFGLCPRGILKNAIKNWVDMGYNPMIGI